MALALSFPAERTAPPKDLEIRPKQVKAWIESLPLAQSLDSVLQLGRHLEAINRAKFDLDDRLQILEAYRPIAGVLLEELESIYARAPLPLPRRARDALKLARALTAELAVGYKIAIAEKTGKLIAFGAKKQLPPLILRAMEYLAAGLRASYTSYTPVTAGIWREMHQLYLHAEQEGIAREAADAASKTTIFDVYSEALLLSLTDPYRLGQGDVDKVLAQLRSARGVVTLGKAKPDTRPGGHFLVPCDADKGPKPALSADDETGGPNWRLLDANPLVDKIRMKKQAIDSGNVSATMSKMVTPDTLALLGKLMTLWGDPPRRAARRDPAESTVAICVGIRAISHFVGLEPKFDVTGDELKGGITLPLHAHPIGDGAQPVPVFEWQVVNQSAGGLKVRRSEVAQPVAVGEAIGIKLTDRPRWNVAVVRWLTVNEEGGMEFGLQFLAPGARMVSVVPTVTQQANQAKVGLLLADADDPATAEVLLTPPNTFSELREYEVEDDGEVSVVRADALLEKTARFELFRVSSS